MTPDQFKNRLNILLALSKSWDRNVLFNQMAQELTDELKFEALGEVDRVDLASKLGGLAGVVAVQEKWLHDQAERVVAQSEHQVSAGRWVI